MSLKFNPPRESARYASFTYGEISSERGTFKVSNNLGALKAATVRNARYSNVKLFENVDGDWYLLYSVPKGSLYGDLPWVKQVGYSWRSTPYKKAVPMTRDEYAEWRVRVERERIADGSASLDLNPGRDFVSPDAYDSATNGR